jgi:hypothetical protein
MITKDDHDELVFDYRVSLPEPVVQKILQLIQQDDVRSVSCNYDDSELWRKLIAEQVLRAKRTGLPPQEAFTLSGPDGGLWDTPVEALGGVVHIPYEGIRGGDLFLYPTWRKFNAEGAEKTGRLSTAIGRCCHYLLSPVDFGELNCATRTPIGEWVLYKAKTRYIPCDPLNSD